MGANGIAVAVETHLGGRTVQQDEALVITGFLSHLQKPLHLLAVFDGHGSEGHKAAKAAKKEFPIVLESLSDKLLEDPQAALKSAFHTVNETLSNDPSWDSYLSGTTAVLALIIDNVLHVAHVGDSRLVLIKQDDDHLIGTALTQDHNCENEIEKNRVIAAGARVEQLLFEGKHDGPFRLFKGSLPYPGITVTRSLGDVAAQRIGVICEPSVTSFTLDESIKYIILATDGLWDGISIEECASIISATAIQERDASKCAAVLLQKGLEGLATRKIDDNLTHIVCIYPI